MSNNFTKNYQDGSGLTEAQLDTAFQTVKPSRANLDFSSFGSVSGNILQSQGSNVTPEWVSLNEVISDTTVSSTAANKILAAATAITSGTVPAAGFANLVSAARTITMSVSSSAISPGLAIKNITPFTSTSNNALVSSIALTSTGRPIQIQLTGVGSVARTASVTSLIFAGFYLEFSGSGGTLYPSIPTQSFGAQLVAGTNFTQLNGGNVTDPSGRAFFPVNIFAYLVAPAGTYTFTVRTSIYTGYTIGLTSGSFSAREI
jgi:hypothetical protein